MHWFDILLILFGALGHMVLGAAFVNRVHAWAAPRWIIHFLTILTGVLGGVAPLFIALNYWNDGWTTTPVPFWRGVILGYLTLTSLLAVWAIVAHVYRSRVDDDGGAVMENHSEFVDVQDAAGEPPIAGKIDRWISRLPGNEVVRLAVQKKTIALPRLAPEHDGLKIAQISDLHISGRITRPYFDEVVARTNAWAPDLTVITGDLFDRDDCLDWGVRALSKLTAPLGVYFIYGNHDQLVDFRRLQTMLEDAGLIYLGGAWRTLEHNGRPFVLAANELPWFAPAADADTMPPRDANGLPTRILLSHAPDQLPWAIAKDFDLMLAGHTHGGQVRFPIVGAIASPSRFGTRYAGGTFLKRGVVMHVSRGTSGLTPLRWNCPPELALLELRRGE